MGGSHLEVVDADCHFEAAIKATIQGFQCRKNLMQNAQPNADGAPLIHKRLHDIAVRGLHPATILLVHCILKLLCAQVRHVYSLAHHKLIVDGVDL